jgi:subtilisin-like proprotein convertase family protein
MTSFDLAFNSLNANQANGIWTLTFRDGAKNDIGTISAANLQIETVPEVSPGFFATAFCALIFLRTVFGKKEQAA